MRFVHTADWHLGRSLGGASFLEDQAWLLRGQFLDALAEHRPDALLIAGDVFDRAVPPTEAVELLDEVLARVVLDLRIPVVLIPGNHDAAERLGFGARVMRAAGLHIVAEPLGDAIRFDDAHGPVAVLAAGYASPLLLAQLLADPAVVCHDSGFALLCERLRALVPPGARSVVVAHAFLAEGEESPSERLLQVGGAKAVSPARFHGFHYVALGHLHRAQAMAGGRIRYSGSPLAYSFAEAAHAKSLTLVEIDATGGVAAQEIPLEPRRRLRTLTGELAALLGAADPATREDWVRVVLTDQGPLWDPMARLREAWPMVLELEFARHAALDAPAPAAAERRAADPLDVMGEFYADMRGRALAGAARAAARAAIEAALAAER
jgi:exonuclease SbcD